MSKHMATEKTDREYFQEKLDALDPDIKKLKGIKLTVAENPAQSANIGGIDYTFESQLEVDRVLYPLVEEFNFISDIIGVNDG